MRGAECTSRSCKKNRNTLSQEEASFDSQNRCKIAIACSIRFSIIPSPQCRAAGDTRQGAIYLQIKYSSFAVHSFALLISHEASFSGASQSSNSSAFCSDNALESSECESPSDVSATSASDFHHHSMLSMLQKCGPALDQVKAWQQAVDQAIDELRQIGPLLSTSTSTDGTDS